MLINTYQLLEDFDGNSNLLEDNLATHFNIKIFNPGLENVKNVDEATKKNKQITNPEFADDTVDRKTTIKRITQKKEKAKEDLSVGIDKLYTQLQKAQDNVRALNTTIELSEELVRIRKKSFAEGMATSTEVVDAETMLATVRVARLAAYYEYDVALMNLLAICGTPERFEKYFETTY